MDRTRAAERAEDASCRVRKHSGEPDHVILSQSGVIRRGSCPVPPPTLRPSVVHGRADAMDLAISRLTLSQICDLMGKLWRG